MAFIKKDVIVIGAGAAGMMCAIEAGRRGRRVLVIDRAEKPGKKILISGGGRCNFTNLHSGPGNFLSENPHFCKSALARFTPEDFIRLVRKHGIPYHEKQDGQLFCDRSARDILALLQKERAEAGAEIFLNCETSKIERSEEFHIGTNKGLFAAESLVIATGGLSIPKMGAGDMAFRTAEKFGIGVVPPRPGLVPLTCDKTFLSVFGDISGVSVDVRIRYDGISFRENMLFTHRGLSGPAVLQISSYWREGHPLEIDLMPDKPLFPVLKEHAQSRVRLDNFLMQFLPKRFCEKFCATYFQIKPVCQYTEKEMKTISETIHRWVVMPEGTEGYDKAEVTCGGIDTQELSSKTMECRKIKGLYFIGECTDVTGHLGGHNFQWAWSSGFTAGQYV